MITIIEAQERHLESVLSIERTSFSVPWSENSFRFELESGDACFIVAEEAGNILGFGILHAFCDEAELFNIAVKRDCRNRGIGGRLVKALLDDASKREISTIFLEVRESNIPAQRLYQKFGFTFCGRRKHYYTDPDEDALLMVHTVSGQGETEIC